MTLLEIVQLLGSLGEFLGAFAVFATLLYLAIQVRDASRASQFAAVEANRAQRISMFSAIRDSPYLPAIHIKIRAGEELTPEERYRLMNHESVQWALTYAEWVQRELGVMGEFATRDELPIELMLSSTSSMEWWSAAGKRIYPNRFVEFVTARAAAHESESSENLRDAVAEVFPV